MRTRQALFLLAVIAGCSLSCLAADKAEQIDQHLSAYHKLGQLNGVVLVADHGRLSPAKPFTRMIEAARVRKEQRPPGK